MMAQYVTFESVSTGTTVSFVDEQCLPSGLKELCIVLATICILLAVILGCLCFALISRYRRKNYGGRTKRTQEFCERKWIDEGCIDVMLNPDENGRFREPLFCTRCKKESTGNFDLCIHYQRMKRFIVLDQNNLVARELVVNRHNTDKKVKRSNASETTIDLNEIMKQFPYVTSSCSMLYSACEYSSTMSLTTASSIDVKSIASKHSFMGNFFEPFKNAAKKLSRNNFHRSQSSVKSSKPNIVEHPNEIHLEVVSGNSWSPESPKSEPEFRRWSAHSSTIGHTTLSHPFLNITSYSNPSLPVSANSNVRWSVGGRSSLKRKQYAKSDRTVFPFKVPSLRKVTPKIVVHPSSVRRTEPPQRLCSLDKRQSTSLQYLTVSENCSSSLLPMRHSISSCIENHRKQKFPSSFTQQKKLLDVPISGACSFSNQLSSSRISVVYV